MADPTNNPGWMDKIRALIEALRAHQTAPSGAERFPLEQQREGYRLHLQEAKMMGEQPLPYDEWLKQQPDLSEPQE